MSEQPTIGKIEQLTTNTDPRSPLDVLNKIKGVVNAPPDWSSKHDGEVWQELDRLRAENARLRKALAQAIEVLDSADGLYFGPYNKIWDSRWQGVTAKDYSPQGLTIDNLGKYYAGKLREALADDNKKGTP